MKKTISLLIALSLTACSMPASNSGVEESTSSSQVVSSVEGSEILTAIALWTQDIEWTVSENERYNDIFHIDLDAGYIIPANTLTGPALKSPTYDLYDHRTSLETLIEAKGWKQDLRLDADGVNGSIWGFSKEENGTIQLLVLHVQQDCTFMEEQENFSCVNPQSSVFLSAPVAIDTVKMKY